MVLVVTSDYTVRNGFFDFDHWSPIFSVWRLWRGVRGVICFHIFSTLAYFNDFQHFKVCANRFRFEIDEQKAIFKIEESHFDLIGLRKDLIHSLNPVRYLIAIGNLFTQISRMFVHILHLSQGRVPEAKFYFQSVQPDI